MLFFADVQINGRIPNYGPPLSIAEYEYWHTYWLWFRLPLKKVTIDKMENIGSPTKKEEIDSSKEYTFIYYCKDHRTICEPKNADEESFTFDVYRSLTTQF